MLLGFSGQKTPMERDGIGDIILTYLNEKSRNYTFGKLLCSDYNKAMKYKENNTVEGLSNLRHIKETITKINKHYNFIGIIYGIIYNNDDIESFKIYLKKCKLNLHFFYCFFWFFF